MTHYQSLDDSRGSDEVRCGNTESKIARVAQPKLFVAAAQDDVAPPAHARRLFDLARSPKELLVVPGAGHNDAYVVGGEKYLAVWRRFLDAINSHL